MQLDVPTGASSRNFANTLQVMQWMVVVLVGGVLPANTDLVFDKFSDCLAGEEQMLQHYSDAFDDWITWLRRGSTGAGTRRRSAMLRFNGY